MTSRFWPPPSPLVTPGESTKARGAAFIPAPYPLADSRTALARCDSDSARPAKGEKRGGRPSSPRHIPWQTREQHWLGATLIPHARRKHKGEGRGLHPRAISLGRLANSTGSVRL